MRIKRNLAPRPADDFDVHGNPLPPDAGGPLNGAVKKASVKAAADQGRGRNGDRPATGAGRDRDGDHVDEREQLVNDQQRGPVAEVSLPAP